MIRGLIVATFLMLYTLSLGPPLIVHCLLTGSVERLYRVAVGGARLALRLAGVRVRVEGVENIPAGLCIFLANHASNVDPPAVVASIPQRVALMAKKGLFRIPLFGTVLRLGGIVPMDRGDREAAIASVEKAVSQVRAGVSFLVFPEGTRSPDGRLRPFKKGASFLAIRTGLPVVPISVVGSHRVMRKNEFAIRPGEVVVKFHPPIDASGYTIEQKDALLARVEAAVREGLPEDQQPTQG